MEEEALDNGFTSTRFQRRRLIELKTLLFGVIPFAQQFLVKGVIQFAREHFGLFGSVRCHDENTNMALQTSNMHTLQSF